MILFLLLALAAGVLLPVQAGLNARLGSALGSPVAAALVSFLVGFPVHLLTPSRLLGAALVIAGVILIQR